MSEKVKVTHKEVKKPDKFREAIANSVVYFSDNYQKMLMAIGGVALAIIVAFVIINFYEKGKLKANSRFEEAIKDYSNGNSLKALDKFMAIKNEYSGAEISKIALYYAGAINYDLGRYDEAAAILSDFLKSGIQDEMLKDAAHLTLGLSSFNKGNWQQAIDQLSKLDKNESPYANQARLHIGLSLEKLGKPDEAKRMHEEALGRVPGNNPGYKPR